MSKDLESMKRLYSEFVRLGNCNPIEFLIQSRKMYDDVNILVEKSINGMINNFIIIFLNYFYKFFNLISFLFLNLKIKF